MAKGGGRRTRSERGYIINEWLKRIVEQTNVLEPGQGGGKQGRSVNINMQKMNFVTHEAHRQGKRVYRVDIDFRKAFSSLARDEHVSYTRR